MRGAFEHAQQFAERDVLLHRDDVGARHHDVVDAALAQPEDVLEHPALVRREAEFAGRHGVEHLAQIGARVRPAAEQRAEHARQPALVRAQPELEPASRRGSSGAASVELGVDGSWSAMAVRRRPG